MLKRNTLQHLCAKEQLSRNLVAHGSGSSRWFGGSKIRAVVQDYPMIRGWTGQSGVMNMQLPAVFHTPVRFGAYKCASFEELKDANIECKVIGSLDGESLGPGWWLSEGHINLKDPLFTADVYAYGGKHERCTEIWMIDGSEIVTDKIMDKLLRDGRCSLHNLEEIDVYCISSEFILSQDKDLNPSEFMERCRKEAENKIVAYRVQRDWAEGASVKDLKAALAARGISTEGMRSRFDLECALGV